MINLLLVLFFSMLLPDSAAVESEPYVIELNAAQIEDRTRSLNINKRFTFENPEGAHLPDFDDSEWEKREHMFWNPKDLDDDWNKIIWYRSDLVVDSTLFNTPVAFTTTLIGAVRVWINGDLIFESGNVTDDPEEYENGIVRDWFTHTWQPERYQVLAVQFANADIERLRRSTFWTGFSIGMVDIKHSRTEALANHRFISGMQWFLIGFCSVFAIIHFLFFLFNRRLRFNLWFALACALYAYASFVQQEFFFYTEPYYMIMHQRLMQSSMAMIFGFIALFLYSVLDIRMSFYFKILFATVTTAALVHGFLININPLILGFALLLAVQIIIISISAFRQQKSGAWLIGGGVLVFLVSILVVLGLELTGMQISTVGFSVFHLPYLGFGIALVAMSVYQSRRLAQLNLDLRKRLTEVKDLSEKNLDQERSIREAEVQRVRLETENERKTAELEKARSLQLSLLPAALPDYPGYTMHAEMLTATEVGGDYYDQIVYSPNGSPSMIWALGDATGHGTEAGFVAAMTKTLFLSHAGKKQTDATLREMARQLKDAGLKHKFMCLGLLEVKDDTVTWCSAGIPPALVIRGDGSGIELLESKGMPLGSVTGFDYQMKSAKLADGDIILLITDGLMEQMNENREQFGMKRIIEVIETVENQSPQEIVSTLKNALNDWRQSLQQQDDITFVCIKRV